MAAVTTPRDDHDEAAESLIIEVHEDLDRSLTRLRRRTRDVIKLGQEREQLIAAIERGVTTPVSTAIDSSDHAIHGESNAFDLSDESPNFDPGDIRRLQEREPGPSWVAEEPADRADSPSSAAVADSHADDRSTPVTQPGPGAAQYVEPEAEAELTEVVVEYDVTAGDAHDDPGSRAPHDVAAADPAHRNRDQVRHEPGFGDAADEHTLDEDTAPEYRLYEEPASQNTAVDEPAHPDSSFDDTPYQDMAYQEAVYQEAVDESENERPPFDDLVSERHQPSYEPSYESSFGDVDVAIPRDGVIDEIAAYDIDDPDTTTASDEPHASAPFGLDDASGSFAQPESTPESEASPFAAAFEEHIEDLGGSLEPSPFDLDEPPHQGSYRPRSLQRHPDRAATERSDVDPVDENLEDDSASPTGLAAAWDDFAGPQDALSSDEDDRGPEASTGSRLRDLVAQAQAAERERTLEGASDFDLVQDQPALSRYDKNSAKLPTVGISSEDLSSSVASLRSTFTADKSDKKEVEAQSGDAGTTSRRDDKKAAKAREKTSAQAAKEAKEAAKDEAKAARAAAKRRKKRN